MTELKGISPAQGQLRLARENRFTRAIRKFYSFMASVKLALVLLIVILLCCAVGVTVFPEQQARAIIFSSLWFNALLVALVANVSFCFFVKILRRKLTLITLGMILFHLSFVFIFAGVIYNSLFYFRGALRLTEGETMGLGDPYAYDMETWGPFFDRARMRGDVTFLKHHINYIVDNQNKGVAHEISTVEGERQVRGAIYPTHNLEFNGFKFYHNKDGFAPLFVLYDKFGRELYGAYVPLQSFEMEKGVFLYTTGTKQEGPGSMEFPQIPDMPPLFRIQFTYDLPKRTKDVPKASFKVWEYDGDKEDGQGRLVFEGTAPLGEKVSFGDFALAMQEVRYWASMDVLYSPGQPIVLASLWVGLGGFIITTVGRLRRGGGDGSGP